MSNKLKGTTKMTKRQENKAHHSKPACLSGDNDGPKKVSPAQRKKTKANESSERGGNKSRRD